MIIKKRFGARNFVQYLGLKDTYSVRTKAKRKQQECLKVVQAMYTNNPDLRKELMTLNKHIL